MKLNLPVRRTLMIVAVMAALAMGVLSVVVSGVAANGDGPRAVVVATGESSTTTAGPVVPRVFAPKWQGNGWPGSGPFKGQDWP